MIRITLSAENIMKDLVEHFEGIEVSILISHFLYMDTINVNSGEKKA